MFLAAFISFQGRTSHLILKQFIHYCKYQSDYSAVNRSIWGMLSIAQNIEAT